MKQNTGRESQCRGRETVNRGLTVVERLWEGKGEHEMQNFLTSIKVLLHLPPPSKSTLSSARSSAGSISTRTTYTRLVTTCTIRFTRSSADHMHTASIILLLSVLPLFIAPCRADPRMAVELAIKLHKQYMHVQAKDVILKAAMEHSQDRVRMLINAYPLLTFACPKTGLKLSVQFGPIRQTI